MIKASFTIRKKRDSRPEMSTSCDDIPTRSSRSRSLDLVRRISRIVDASNLVALLTPRLSNETAMSPLPDLPTELVIRIFQITSSLSYDSAVSISLVSTWARSIALSYLFSTVIHRAAPLTPAQLTIATRSSLYPTSRTQIPEKLGRFVSNLWTESIGMSNPAAEMDIFQACPQVENLALPSASLRALSNSLQALARNPPPAGSTRFPCNVSSITMLTHTFRHDWHFLVGAKLPSGTPFLHNITHLRLLDMQVSAYVPHAHLPHLTHLALPYLDIGSTLHELLRAPAAAGHTALRMIVLTVDERKFLSRPWSQLFGTHARDVRKGDVSSPRDNFRELALGFRDKDARTHVILSPRAQETACTEWEAAARAGESIWDRASRSREDDAFLYELPTTYPKGAKR